MKSFSKSSIDFRWLLFLLIVIYIGLLLYWVFIKQGTQYEIFNIYSFFGSSKGTTFQDLELLLCGVDSLRNGQNPYTNLCYEGAAPYNYPTTWKVFSWIPWFQNDYRLEIGWIMIFTFVGSLFKYIGKIDWIQFILYLFFIFSPPVLMLLDFGNSDLIILNILLISLLLFSQRILSFAISFSAILKLFPIGGIMSVLNYKYKNRNHFIYALLVIILPFLLYIVLGWRELFLIKQNTPNSMINFSYGLSKTRINIMDIIGLNFPFYTLVFYLGYFLGLILFYLLFGKIKKMKIDSGKFGSGFLLGSGIFFFSYLFQINFEYRLTFLILTFPQIFIWFKLGIRISLFLLFGTIIILWDESLTMFWNLFFDAKAGLFYYLLRSIRDIVCLGLSFFYFSVAIHYFLDYKIKFVNNRELTIQSFFREFKR